MEPSPRKLYRSRTDKVIAGVCGGLGEYFALDPILFRIIFLLLLLAGGSGFWLYLVLAILMPADPLPGQPATAGARENFQEFMADLRRGAQRFTGPAEAEAEAGQRPDRAGFSRTWLGVGVVGIGVILLLDRLFPRSFLNGDLLWPLAIIFLGIVLLSRQGRNR